MGWPMFWTTVLMLLLVAENCGCEQMGAEVLPEERSNDDLKISRGQILSAQFECYLKIITDPPRHDSGPYCNRTWDGWLCWGDSSPGTAVQPCPFYYEDFDPSEKVTKVCNPDGQWFRHPESNRIWSNYTLCSAYTKEKLKVAYSSYYLAILGHGLSVVSLIISLCIFSYFKSLSCQRISLHKNMFLSFILNSVCTVITFSAVVNNQPLVQNNPIGCKVLSVLNLYTFGTNYFWMLCEGIYLHTLIIVAVFVGEQQLGWYYLLGWGFPLVPAITHAVARWLFFDDNCWISSDTYLIYIIHGPILAALLVNLFFLLNIVRVLITKLKVTHSAESNVYMKAVRATLILVPLLGNQFILVPWSPEGRTAKAVFEFVMNIFSHFHGLLVAIIFCFCNAEVQAVLKRQWKRYRVQCRGQSTVAPDSHSNYNTNSSITETSRFPPSSEFQYKQPQELEAVRQSNGQTNGESYVNGRREGPWPLKTLKTTII